MTDINSKNTPNLMRTLMKRMRVGNDHWERESEETIKPNLDMRNMMKISRKMNEDSGERSENKETAYDQSMEEEKFKNYFKDSLISVKFNDLEVYDDLVVWGGVIDGIIKFAFVVSPDDDVKKPQFDYESDLVQDNPDYENIMNMVESYYKIFYKYWVGNLIQK